MPTNHTPSTPAPADDAPVWTATVENATPSDAALLSTISQAAVDLYRNGFAAGERAGFAAGIQAERERLEASVAEYNRMHTGYVEHIDQLNAAK